MRRHLSVICLFMTALFIASIGLADTCHAVSPVKIAMITAKTGEAGASSVASFEGARFAVNEINSAGGLLGRRVVLMEYDNESTAEGSIRAARQAVADGAVAVIGASWSSHSLAMADVLQAARVPMITHISTNPAVTRKGDYIFRACFTDSFQGVGLARFARYTLRDRTAVVLVDESRTYSQGLAQTFISAFEQAGGRILLRAGYDTGNLASEAIMAEVVALKPDALFIPGDYADFAALVERGLDMGLESHILSGDGIGIRLFEYLGDKADNIYYAAHWSRGVETETSRDFVRRYEAVYGVLERNSPVLAYDSVMLLADAITRADSLDGPKIRDALAGTRAFEGVTGVIRFDEHGDPVKPLVINQFKFGGILYITQVAP